MTFIQEQKYKAAALKPHKSIYLPDLENCRLALAFFSERNNTYLGITFFWVQSNMRV